MPELIDVQASFLDAVEDERFSPLQCDSEIGARNTLLQDRISQIVYIDIDATSWKHPEGISAEELEDTPNSSLRATEWEYEVMTTGGLVFAVCRRSWDSETVNYSMALLEVEGYYTLAENVEDVRVEMCDTRAEAENAFFTILDWVLEQGLITFREQ